MQKTMRKLLRAVAGYDPTYYDMYADPNEAFFGRLYLARILHEAAEAEIRSPSSILDAGCQAGRLAIPLAQEGFRVTGIDTSSFALRRATHHAKAASVTLTLEQGDIAEVLQDHPHWQYDLVVCAEVLYQSAGYRDILEALVKAVRPGGLLCVSHRPSVYYLIEALRHRDWATARLVLSAEEGHFEGPFPERGYYNWQTEESLRALYKGLGMQWVALYPIDRYARLSGLSPSQLTSEQRDEWLQMELQEAGDTGICARYLLVVASRP